ncbi:hypothetical protein N8D56_06085 [Devosia sp. A8/3-2]|nr:hypothetical protein N8D56_06085 [Devosia sp. A8/3-2]
MTEFIFFINQVVISGAVLGCIYALGAVGITLVFGILRFAHFAHSELMTSGAFFAFLLAGAFAAWALSRPFPWALWCCPLPWCSRRFSRWASTRGFMRRCASGGQACDAADRFDRRDADGAGADPAVFRRRLLFVFRA